MSTFTVDIALLLRQCSLLEEIEHKCTEEENTLLDGILELLDVIIIELRKHETMQLKKSKRASGKI